MKSHDFHRLLANATGLTIENAKRVFEATQNLIITGLVDGSFEEVRCPILGGKFVRRDVKARVCRNPRNGERVAKAPYSKIVFKRYTSRRDINSGVDN